MGHIATRPAGPGRIRGRKHDSRFAGSQPISLPLVRPGRAGRALAACATALLLLAWSPLISRGAIAQPQDVPAGRSVHARVGTMAALSAGDRFGNFRAEARFTGVEGLPAGMRFVHTPTGMPVDVLSFDSIPQAMIWVETPPISDRGAPHTAEHLVLGKGRKARYAALLLDMSMGSNSASTHRDKTLYHFNTAGGRQSFLELIYRFLDSITHPDVTDEEIRREVAHLGVEPAEEGGRLKLDEKGTVYLEMVSSFEKPGTIVWSEVRRLLYGAGHPLGLESGGRPAALRTMTPTHMRDFFEHRYRPGETMGLILGLPPHFDLELFLGDLDGILRKIANGPDAAASSPSWPTLATLPPPAPPEEPRIVRLPFPSANSTEPGPVVVGWAPFGDLTAEDLFRLEALWHVYSGDDASFVYRDLVDGASRRVGPGISDAGGWINAMPGHCPMLWLDGVSSDAMTEEALEEIRAVLTERLAWIAALAPGSAELEAFHEKVRTYLTANRRFLIEQTEAPPRFGYRGTGDFWYRHLREQMRQPGFEKDLLQEDLRARLLRDLDKGNPWTDLIERLALRRRPAVIVAAYPDVALPARQAARKQARLEEGLADLMRRYDTGDPQEALERYRADFAEKTAELRRIEDGIGKPGFLTDPPMTLDDTIDSRVTALALATAGGEPLEVPVVYNRFGRTSLLDLGLYFDVTRVPPSQWIYLSILPEAFGELGCWSPDTDAGAEGDSPRWLTHQELRQRLQREVSGLEAEYDVAPGEDRSRVEFAIYGTGLGLDEGSAALAWIQSLLHSAARIDTTARVRLRDLVTREIGAIKQLPLGSEEAWVDNPARAYRYQDEPVLLSATSMFTRLHHLQRLRWRLHAAPPDDALGPIAVWVNETLAGGDLTRGALYAAIDTLRAAPGAAEADHLRAEVADYLRAELEACPDETLEEDFIRLTGETIGDLMIPPEQVLAGLRRAMASILAQGPKRAHLTGSTRNVDRLRPQLEILLARLARDAAPRAREGTARYGATRRGDGGLHASEDSMLITGNLRSRYPEIAAGPRTRPVRVALRLESSRSAVFIHSADLVSYEQRYYSNLVDMLAARIFGGAGAHGLFMQTWGAGLAYSNGVGANPRRGLVSYYAERCGDGVATLRFVGDLLDHAPTTLTDEFYLDYALAGCFGDYRGGDTYLRRGRAMAADWADGITPEKVRAFKEALVDLRRKWQEPDADGGADLTLEAGGILDQVLARLPEVLGPVVPGYGAAASPENGAVSFMIGPQDQIRAVEQFVAGATEISAEAVARPDAADASAQPDAADASAQPHAADASAQPHAADASAEPAPPAGSDAEATRILRLYPRDFWIDGERLERP